MEIRASIVVNRAVADVWRFWAVDHVKNHPRWDPEMELKQITDGPIGIGTRIRRRNTRWGAPVEGEMEVVEFEPEKTIAMLTRDANMEIHGRALFEAQGPENTILTLSADIPGLEEPAASVITKGMERSLANAKALIEAEK